MVSRATDAGKNSSRPSTKLGTLVVTARGLGRGKMGCPTSRDGKVLRAAVCALSAVQKTKEDEKTRRDFCGMSVPVRARTR